MTKDSYRIKFKKRSKHKGDNQTFFDLYRPTDLDSVHVSGVELGKDPENHRGPM